VVFAVTMRTNASLRLENRWRGKDLLKLGPSHTSIEALVLHVPRCFLTAELGPSLSLFDRSLHIGEFCEDPRISKSNIVSIFNLRFCHSDRHCLSVAEKPSPSITARGLIESTFR
jgi:hypothetical protein